MRITEKRFYKILDSLGFEAYGYMGRFRHSEIPNSSYGLVFNRAGNADYFKTARQLLFALNDARGNDDANAVVRQTLQDMERKKVATS